MATDDRTLRRLRRYRPDDAETLVDVYRDAVVTLGRLGYSDVQVRVWARYPEDLEGFRRGHASAIMDRLEERARASGVRTLRVEASVVARPFFERRGFRLVELEHPVRHGVEFTRCRMKKRVTAS